MNKEETVKRLEAFLNLFDAGVTNTYIQDNIKFYATRYHSITGDWYHRQLNQNRKV